MDIRDAIIEVAESYLGTPYSKLDCSAFVRAVFRQFGYELPRVSATQAKTIEKLGLATRIDLDMTASEIAKLLKPGDVAWLRHPKYTTRYLFIHHIVIYIGDGLVIESAGEGVKIRGIWETSKWQIIMIADITSLLKYDGEIEESEDEEMIVLNDTRTGLVKELQTNLVALGYDLGTYGDNGDGVDGKYGSKTFNAVRDFQNDYSVANIDDTNSGYVTMETAIAIATAKGDNTELQEAISEDITALTGIKSLADEIAEKAAGRL